MDSTHVRPLSAAASLALQCGDKHERVSDLSDVTAPQTVADVARPTKIVSRNTEQNMRVAENNIHRTLARMTAKTLYKTVDFLSPMDNILYCII